MSANTTRTPRVHQVLATLGYGDAIGHEVLGIQRALESAGYESSIFVEEKEIDVALLPPPGAVEDVA